MAKIKIKFEGIDSWNRPIFKSIKTESRYGSVDILFDYRTTEKDVIKKIDESCLLWFGNSFDCEPMGDKTEGLKIISEFKGCDKILPEDAITEIIDVLNEITDDEFILKVYKTVCWSNSELINGKIIVYDKE